MSLSCSKYVSLATHLLYELLNNTESNTNTSPTMLALVALTYAWSHVLSILVMKLKFGDWNNHIGCYLLM